MYPKAEAPKPPFHCFCLCLTAPRIDLINPKPRLNSKAEQTFLATLPAKEAAQVAGSFEKRRRILEDKESLEGIYNQGKDPLYQWKRVGDLGDNPLIDPAPSRSPLKITTLPNVEISPKLSDPFLQEIDQALSVIPAWVLTTVEQHGDSLKLSPQLKELLPELSGKPMLGDLSGRTFDQSPGLYDRREKSILIFEYVVDTHPPFRMIKNNRASGVLRHEMGHALDRALGGWSDQPAFRRAYDQDIAEINDEALIDEYAYYLTRKGRSELFAELFAVLQGGGADEKIGNIKRVFPATVVALQALLEKKP